MCVCVCERERAKFGVSAVYELAQSSIEEYMTAFGITFDLFLRGSSLCTSFPDLSI